MKKGFKTLLTCLLGLCTLASCSNLGGTVADTPQEGTGEYDWAKYTRKKYINTGVEAGFYPGNCEGDLIYELNFYSWTEKNGEESIYIDYETYFNIFDDLEVFFVLTDDYKVYTTDIIVSHIPQITRGKVQLPNYCSTYYIWQVWLRTVD